MFTLPPLPDGVRTLRDDELARLRRFHPSLQRSLAECRTCLGNRVFRWYAEPDRPLSTGTVVDYECDCARQLRLSYWLMWHNIGVQQARWCWGDAEYVPEPVHRSVQEYAERVQAYAARGLGLFLYGTGNGTGKTLIATLLLKRFIAQGLSGYWTTFNQLIDSYTATWRDAEERDWFERNVRNTQVLVLDDIGKEAAGRKNTVDAAIDSLLRTRVQNGLVTIATSNYSPLDQRWNERYTRALGSLFAESCIPVEFGDGKDWRDDATQRTLQELRAGLTRPWTL